jgi:hypothetical protein
VVSYREAVTRIGPWGLLGRGLGTKILANGVQGMTFGLCWRFLDTCMFGNRCMGAC